MSLVSEKPTDEQRGSIIKRIIVERYDEKHGCDTIFMYINPTLEDILELFRD